MPLFFMACVKLGRLEEKPGWAMMNQLNAALCLIQQG